MEEGAAELPVDLKRFAPGLARTCDDYLIAYRDRVADAVRRGDAGLEVVRRHTRAIDGLLGALFCAADAASRVSGKGPRGAVSLLAVGSYGRGALGLRSDIDLVFLCEDADDPAVGTLTQAFLYTLWDLKLSVGHAVRSVPGWLQLAREDLASATALLDVRRVAGDVRLAQVLAKGAREHVFDVSFESFLDGLEKDLAARRERFGGSPYLLEPDVKLGHGGLRDLDVLGWALGGRFGTADLAEVVRRGALVPREAKEIEASRERIWRIRNWLHLRAGRRQDRLTFEDQEEIAAHLGYVDDATLAVEQLMQDYYQGARGVGQLVDRVLTRVRPTSRRAPATTVDLGDGTLLFGEHVTLKDTDDLARDPALALRLFRQVVRRDFPPYAFARDAIAKHSADPTWRAALRANPEAAEHFVALLMHVGEVPVARRSILVELHDVGLLTAMIPEFDPVVGRVQHDVYHVYTVDVHSVAAVDRLKAIARGELTQTMPLATRLAAEAPLTQALFVALLVHDIGKGQGKDHSARGALMARPIAERLGLSESEAEHVVWLVREHLSLYHWATRRDTSDPDTIAELARIVGTVERLRDLYILTVADLSTTSPTAMTSWKARMLEETFHAIARSIEGGSRPSIVLRADEARRRVEASLSEREHAERRLAYARSMPDRYLLANGIEAIVWHESVVAAAEGRTVHVAVRNGVDDDVAELVVVTSDKPGLLADITAALSANRLDVSGAQIYTRVNEQGLKQAVDLFTVKRAARTADGVDEPTLTRITRDLESLLVQRTTTGELLSARATTTPFTRATPAVPTEVRVDNHASGKFTVVEVYTRDRPGLLHVIARTLHEQGLSIALSKINTEGHRVADVFYVEDERGGQVTDLPRLQRLPIVLREVIRKHERAIGNPSGRDGKA